MTSDTDTTEIVRHTVDSILAPHMVVFYAAYIVAFVFTPIMRVVAKHYDIMDRPDGARKMHRAPVAYLGGVAVFLGWLAGLAISQARIGALDNTPSHLHVRMSIVAGAIVVVILGLWDDTKGLRPVVKICGQVIAGVMLLIEGVGSDCVNQLLAPVNNRLLAAHFPMIPQPLMTAVSGLAVIFMVVACCNATNLMDGLDGLCGGVTAVIAAGFLFLATHLASVGLDPEWDGVRVVLSLALLGAVLGFIPFNFNPASIFMGDTGSMFLGFACATMMLLLADQQSRWFLAAMVMFALPVMDTALALARRYVNDRPLFSADRHHFHHQMVARGFTVRQTVVISYALSIGFTVLGAMIVFFRVRYAVAIYLVTFGSIIVAAYKMGMVHEKSRVENASSLSSGGMEPSDAELEPQNVLEVGGAVEAGGEGGK